MMKTTIENDHIQQKDNKRGTTDEPVLIEYDDSPPQPPKIRREKVGGVTYMLTHSQVRALQKEARRMEANNVIGTTKTI